MRDYRAYIMGLDGHVTGRHEFWAEDDEKAKEQAKQYVDGHDIELWHRDKKIAELSSKTASNGADSSTAA